jgi:hypothetical protein
MSESIRVAPRPSKVEERPEADGANINLRARTRLLSLQGETTTAHSIRLPVMCATAAA